MSIGVLLVEDNHSLANTLVDYLELEDIACDHAATGPQGLQLAMQNDYDTILLDINLPQMSGLQVCESLRKAGVDVPVLMLTARDTLDDKLAGFSSGTDDYLIKPFEMSELIARIRALANRRSAQARVLTVGSLTMDLSTKNAMRENQQLELTPTGWRLLELLMRASPDVVSRRRIESALWPDDDIPDSDVLKVHLYRLRQQVDKPFRTQLIQTVANHGVSIRDNEG